MEGGFRQMINNVRPIVRPEDLRGIKFRVLQSPIYIEMFRSLGGNAVPMAWGETFTAVQQGAIDGLEIPLGIIDQNKYFEVTKYLSLTGHIYSMIGLLMAKRTFDRLPADLRGPVQEAAAEATAAQRTRQRRVQCRLPRKPAPPRHDDQRGRRTRPPSAAACCRCTRPSAARSAPTSCATRWPRCSEAARRRDARRRGGDALLGRAVRRRACWAASSTRW